MIDLSKEAALTLSRARHLPILKRDGRPPDLATMYRWSSRGVRGVMLETAQVGSSRVTTAEAAARFLKQLAAGSTAAPQPKAEAADDAERAEKELASEWGDKPGRRRRATAGAGR